MSTIELLKGINVLIQDREAYEEALEFVGSPERYIYYLHKLVEKRPDLLFLYIDQEMDDPLDYISMASDTLASGVISEKLLEETVKAFEWPPINDQITRWMIFDMVVFLSERAES